VKDAIEYYEFVLEELDIDAVQNAFIIELQEFESNPPDPGVKEGYSLVVTIREILWNYSDSSHSFSESVAESNLFQVITFH